MTITATQRRDELNIVARAMEVFRPAGITRERAQAEQSEVVDQLSHALDQLAQQNLECRIEADVPAEYAKLRHDFKRAVDARSRAIGTVRIGAAGVMAAIITQVAEMSLPLRQPAPERRPPKGGRASVPPCRLATTRLSLLRRPTAPRVANLR